MSVTVPLRRAVVAAACAVVAHSAVAQSSETIVVTGAREPMAVSRLAADVTVMDADAIRASTADSLATLLQREAGVQISRNGGAGAATSVMLRGANGSHTVVLVDGVRIGSATLADPSVNALPLAQIERIEVLRGPGSSLYGADAVGGIVNIVTRRAAAGVRFDAAAAMANRGGRELSAGASGTFGAWDVAASLARQRDDGEDATREGHPWGIHNPDHDGYTRDSAQARIGFEPAPAHRIGLTLLRSRLEAQIDAAEAPSYDPTPDYRDKLEVDSTALEWRGRIAAGLVATARLDRSVDDARSGYAKADRFRTTRDHALAQLAWESGVAGQFVAAAERLQEDVKSSTYVGERRERDTNTAVLAWTGQADRFAWQADLRRDKSADYGGETTGRLGGSFALTSQWKLRALVGTAFRAPSFNDLYYPGYGVPPGGAFEVKPERSRSSELGLEWRDNERFASATVYRNRVHDLIGTVEGSENCPDDPAYTTTYEWGGQTFTNTSCVGNTHRALLKGATLSGGTTLGNWSLRGQVDFLDAKDLDSGARLMRRAAHQETLAADWSRGALSAGASVLRVGARPDPNGQVDAETMLDLKVGWRVSKAWTLESRLTNATDRDLEPAAYYHGPGRQFWLGVRYEGGV